MSATSVIDGIDFDISPRVERGAGCGVPERKARDPLYRPMRIFALDPTRGRGVGGVSLVNVPFERVDGPGPKGHLFEVRDSEIVGEDRRKPLDVNHPVFLLEDGRDPSPADPLFRAQMVYAVCAMTYDAFRRALGREIPWGFDRVEADGGAPRLVLRPAIQGERNAYYDAARGELRFGLFQADPEVGGLNVPRGTVAAALMHDVVVHEMSHALLDGLRAKFMTPTGPDVPAFHEAFADLIAIFLRFTYRDVVREAIVATRADLTRSSVLSEVGVQFAQTTGRGGRLRDAAREPDKSLRFSEDEHDRGEVLVAAAYRAFATVFARKAAGHIRLATGGTGVFPPGRIPDSVADALTDIACRLGRHFLNICIRAIDYCPPVDIELGEFLRAVVTADSDLVADDPWFYREAWIDAFRAYDITPPGVAHLSEASLRWSSPDTADQELAIPELSFSELAFDGDPGHPANREELRRQAAALGRFAARKENLAYFGLATSCDPALDGDSVDLPTVQSVRTSRRLGPDGQVLFDLVAEITQRRTIRPRHGMPVFQFHGGTTVIIDPRGRVRYVIRKSVLNEERLAAQATFIAANSDRSAGTSLWITTSDGERLERPQRFRLLHERKWRGDPVAGVAANPIPTMTSPTSTAP